MSKDEVKSAIFVSGVLQTGHFVFADGGHALVKLEMDALWDHPEELSVVLYALANAPDLPTPDVILGVPTGGQRLASELIERKLLDIPIARLERVPGGAKQDFRFFSSLDEQFALSAKSVLIYEDVVTTLSSVAGVVRLLDPARQDIHAVAIWRRGQLKTEYSKSISTHFLIEEDLPVFSAQTCPVCGEV